MASRSEGLAPLIFRRVARGLAALGVMLATAGNALVGWLLYDTYGTRRPLEAQEDFGLYMAALKLCGFAIAVSSLVVLGARAGLYGTDLDDGARWRRRFVVVLATFNALAGVAAILGAYWIPKIR